MSIKKCYHTFWRWQQKKNIGATIRIGRELQCLPYAGFKKIDSEYFGNVLIEVGQYCFVLIYAGLYAFVSIDGCLFGYVSINIELSGNIKWTKAYFPGFQLMFEFMMVYIVRFYSKLK